MTLPDVPPPNNPIPAVTPVIVPPPTPDAVVRVVPSANFNVVVLKLVAVPLEILNVAPDCNVF